jgi:hypothetical protein
MGTRHAATADNAQSHFFHGEISNNAKPAKQSGKLPPDVARRNAVWRCGSLFFTANDIPFPATRRRDEAAR